MTIRHTLTARGIPILVAALGVAAWAAAPLRAEPRHGGPHAWSDFAERHDVNGDGRVSAEELFQTSDHFDRLDADGDDFVTEADFDAHRSAMAFTFLAHRADGNRDGGVTAAEWDDWFAGRDTNDDGVLDPEDFAERRRGTRGPHPAFAEALDADGDGAVSRADLTALAGRYDEDGDGVVERDELPEVSPRHGRRLHRRGPGHGRGRGDR